MLSRASAGLPRRLLLSGASSRQARSTPLWIQRRLFFGIGDVLGVLANPGGTLRQITESKKLLEEAREELQAQSEKAQIPPSHTFAPLPSFFPRKKEQEAIERCLSGVPSFLVLFGASSVGKTALLRQILSDEKYHVLHFDLRIAGFADLPSLYFSLALQLEYYFREIVQQLPGYNVFEQESWAFKHDRFGVEERVKNGGVVKTADVARLMERFQSSLLKYWEFEPEIEQSDQSKGKGEQGMQQKKSQSLNKQGAIEERTIDSPRRTQEVEDERQPQQQTEPDEEHEEAPSKPVKMVPVLLLDEAHKLPALLQSDETIKSLLDSMLVLTKQDRLVHIVLATSDSFFMQHLRQMNVLQHCIMMTVGDPSYHEAKDYFNQQLLPGVPDHLKHRLDFEELYDYFGGKLTHLADVVDDWVNSEGELPLRESSHYLQALSLLNLQLVHAQDSGFDIYSSVPDVARTDDQGFTSAQLIEVMRSLRDAQPVPWHLEYFPLCRQMGPSVVNSMVRSRTLELRWSPAPTLEGRNPQRRPFKGPVLTPATPVLQAAIRDVLAELGE